MPFFEKNYAHGNLYIDFDVVFPDKMNENQLKELFKVRISIYIRYCLYPKTRI